MAYKLKPATYGELVNGDRFLFSLNGLVYTKTQTGFRWENVENIGQYTPDTHVFQIIFDNDADNLCEAIATLLTAGFHVDASLVRAWSVPEGESIRTSVPDCQFGVYVEGDRGESLFPTAIDAATHFFIKAAQAREESVD